MKYVHPSRSSVRYQRGVYAIEFAFVYLIFFTILYAIICLGIFLAIRFAMQNAAEDGARAALRYQNTLSERAQKAKNVAESQSTSLFTTNPVVTAVICAAGQESCASSSPVCGATWDQRCQINVKITVTGFNQILPPIPSFAVPNSLVVRASMLLDGKAL